MSLDWQEELEQEQEAERIREELKEHAGELTFEQEELILEQGLENWREKRDCVVND